jgi:hypothetical protein
LQRHVERMPQMELSGHVGRRDDDRERIALTVGIGLEITAVDPELKPSLLRGFRIECLAKFQKKTAV